MSETDELALPAVVESPAPQRGPTGPLGRWLLAHRVQPAGPEAPESHAKPHSW
jgi:hypothetical protein